MKTSDFNFDLPSHLIAQFPPEKRGLSRLMTLDRITGETEHRTVLELPGILCAEKFLSPEGEPPLLVFNDTKVRKARLIGRSAETNAQVEFLLLEKAAFNKSENSSEKSESFEWKALARRASRRKTGSCYVFFDSNGNETARAEITGTEGEVRYLKFDKPLDDDWLDKYGSVPLPPYIKRKDIPSDAARYQTIYAEHAGSAASPTAGLHFTKEIINSLTAKGIEKAFVTLHVGLGTFQPVRSFNIEDHVMHEEKFNISEENALLIENAIAEKRKIIAIGTTSLRALESAFSKEQLTMNNEQCAKTKNLRKRCHYIKRGWQRTSIFIYPGYKFKAVDALFTNFHTPQSTLLMLVCAFAGKELILDCYAKAVKNEYRFFSYGDAMLIT